MGRRQQDHYGKRARNEGFAARSVYKLQEIDRRLQLFRSGQRVLDLGAYPGSWSQYAAKRVGPKGFVLGLDIQARDTEPVAPNAEMRHADIFDTEPESLGEALSFDIVMSDMAPSTTGKRDLDQYRSFELFMRALQISKTLCKPGGNFVGKIFQGGEFPEAQKAVREAYSKARVIKPKATRGESYEVFIAGLGRKSEASRSPGEE